MMTEQKNASLWYDWKLGAEQSYQECVGKNEVVLIAILKGSVDIHWGEYVHTISEKGMCILPMGGVYECKAGAFVKGVSCRFIPEILAEIFPMQELVYLCGNDPFKWTATLKTDEICYYFLLLAEYYHKKGIATRIIQEMKCRELFHLLKNMYGMDELAEFLRPALCKEAGFRAFIIGNWKKARNVEELAAMANLSTSGFKKKFEKYFNESPYRWIIQQKKECVLAEIIAGKIPLKVIADKYHFASYGHFCTFCKTQYGRPATDLQGGEDAFFPSQTAV